MNIPFPEAIYLGKRVFYDGEDMGDILFLEYGLPAEGEDPEMRVSLGIGT